ncbi:ABC-type nitrate/sulfonate/bicarbonate transport system permease component [Krasilnikovia cinnamomea]|uniref:ABC-type nitrate/sulfonate/bicarbonate transport system permease component n=1 Tax=Krasilnikovia cinnamomea TaxID=349313 RepID=A0A4Q7ZNT1_9ACTN|nr:ABC transporter permease subunit [Krasilnikovia cinnamomea]RZU52700.1 ABC-type nitrate/sulfonate/bicarbonate transport system permease component [Krasilnikovia cinnamomea]
MFRPTALSALGLAGAAALWEATTRTGIVAETDVPTLSSTLTAFGGLLGSAMFWTATGDTLRSWALGLLVSAAIAIPLGLAVGASDRAWRFIRVPVEALRPIPPVVILPLALLVLAGGIEFKVFLIAQGALWPLLIQTSYGVRHTDAVVLDTARSYRLDWWRRIVFVRLPAALPMVVIALQIAAATAFAISLATELVGGAPGLGQLLVVASSGDDLPQVYALTLAAGVFGLLVATAFGALHRLVVAGR